MGPLPLSEGLERGLLRPLVPHGTSPVRHFRHPKPNAHAVGANRRLAKDVTSSNSLSVGPRRLKIMSGIKSFYINKGFTRREALGLGGALALSHALPAWAATDEIGEVIDAKGEV